MLCCAVEVHVQCMRGSGRGLVFCDKEGGGGLGMAKQDMVPKFAATCSSQTSQEGGGGG